MPVGLRGQRPLNVAIPWRQGGLKPPLLLLESYAKNVKLGTPEVGIPFCLK